MLTVFDQMEARRRELGMTRSILAERSGVSLPTLVRVLSGKQPNAAFGKVRSIAEALGMTIALHSCADPDDLLKSQARRKADVLVGTVQGTSGLEGQALPKRALERMKQRTVHELLSGSRRNLWSQ